MPSVTTNGGMPIWAISTPLMKPASSATASAAPMPTQIEWPSFISTPTTIADSPMTEPTDRSMPPVMITAVMPKATMATSEKLRVTLNRLLDLVKVSVTVLSSTIAMSAASSTQNTWRDSSQASGPCARRLIASSSVVVFSSVVIVDSFVVLRPSRPPGSRR